VDRLLQEGAEVTVVDIKVHPKSIFVMNNLTRQVKLELVDVRDKKNLFLVFTKNKPDYVIHLAADPLVEVVYNNPYRALETNILGTVNILEICRKLDRIKGIIVASTDKAYGKTKKAYTEDTPLRGDHPYGVSKACADLISYSYFQTYNLPVVITRLANVYGEGDLNFHRIIPDICCAVIENKVLNLRSNGKYVRDYIYIKDAVDAYIFLLRNIEKVKGEAFNFSSYDNLSVIDVIKKSEKALKVIIPYTIKFTAKNEIPFQKLNIVKARKFGWHPFYTMDNVLNDTLQWYRKILY